MNNEALYKGRNQLWSDHEMFEILRTYHRMDAGRLKHIFTFLTNLKMPKNWVAEAMTIFHHDPEFHHAYTCPRIKI